MDRGCNAKREEATKAHDIAVAYGRRAGEIGGEVVAVSLITRLTVLDHGVCPDVLLSGTSSLRTIAAVFHELAVHWINVLSGDGWANFRFKVFENWGDDVSPNLSSTKL